MRRNAILLLTTVLFLMVACVPEAPTKNEQTQNPSFGIEEKDVTAPSNTESQAPVVGVPNPPVGAPPLVETNPIFVPSPRSVSSPLLNRGGSGGNSDACPADPNKLSPGECGCGVRDDDSDHDGVVECKDNCPRTINTDQHDADGDGVGDECDNCPHDPNPAQDDQDFDGVGTACDCDDQENQFGIAFGPMRYVDSSKGVDQGDCTNFDSPCRTIAYTLLRAEDGDTISLAKGVFHEGNLVLDKRLFIMGYGSEKTVVRADGTTRVFTVPESATLDDFILLCGMTITGGSADRGGGILNQDELLLAGTVVTENHATSSGGGIFSEGAAVLFNSKVTNNTSAGNGGGISSHELPGGNTEFVFLIFSQVESNRAAGSGGGIFSSGGGVQTVWVFSSIFNNTAQVDGGGVHAEDGSLLQSALSTINGNFATNGNGGGISIKDSLADSENTTISGNFASFGGGVAVNANGFFLPDLVTITQNSATMGGGGVFNDGVMASRHTIIADQANGFDCAGAGIFSSNNFNLESAATCNFNATNDLQNANASLGPLLDNGGFTLTHALQLDSDAIDAGNTNCSTDSDQRNERRPVNIVGVDPIDAQARCDIGAFEVQP